MFTEKFIRDVVLPEVESTGGATVLTSPYGMPPALLKADKYQPPTWIVGLGAMPLILPVELLNDSDYVTTMANAAYESAIADSWSAVGFWVHDGHMYVEPVRTFTSHYMAVECAKECDQIAIFALHTGEVQFLAQETQVPLVPLADR